MLKIKPFFKWYDFWIGAFFDQGDDVIYICPLPMIGVRIQLFKVICLGRWQIILTSGVWFGKGLYPDERYPVFHWWHIGPIEVRRFVYAAST